GVAHAHEAVLACDAVGPRLHGRSGDLDGPAAGATHQMMVVVAAALPEQLLAAGQPHDVDLAGVGHRLQSAIDRGQTDALATPAQQPMQLLGAAEVVDVCQQRGDRIALPGVALTPGTVVVRTHASSLLPPSFACATASATMCAMCSSVNVYSISRPRRDPCTTPADRSTRRCCDTSGCGASSASTSWW